MNQRALKSGGSVCSGLLIRRGLGSWAHFSGDGGWVSKSGNWAALTSPDFGFGSGGGVKFHFSLLVIELQFAGEDWVLGLFCALYHT